MAARLAVVVLLAETSIQRGVGSRNSASANSIFITLYAEGGSSGHHSKGSPRDRPTCSWVWGRTFAAGSRLYGPSTGRLDLSGIGPVRARSARWSTVSGELNGLYPIGDRRACDERGARIRRIFISATSGSAYAQSLCRPCRDAAQEELKKCLEAVISQEDKQWCQKNRAHEWRPVNTGSASSKKRNRLLNAKPSPK
jgi:hypothetical protein